MKTDDKIITTPGYWDKIYAGKNDNAAVDASNTKRTSTFDRFQWVVDIVDKGRVLGIASGHARVEARLKAQWPEDMIIATDQAPEAKKAAAYHPYFIMSGYDIQFPDKSFDTVIITQAMEYFERLDDLMREVKRLASKFICTIPTGEMSKWSQLYIFNEKDFCEWLSKYGTIELVKREADILLVKLKLND